MNCSVPDCTRPYRAKGYCAVHYERIRHHGSTDLLTHPTTGDEDYFWGRVEQTDSCWLWTGPIGWNGYGLLARRKIPVRAHRFAYELLVGAIPEGLTLDHLCRVRHCVNPAHLEPVTIGENLRRGHAARAQARAEDLAKPKIGERF